MTFKKKWFIYSLGLAILTYSFYNSIIIYKFSYKYSEDKSDVAIILGAGTNNDSISPIYRERVNHGIYLYDNEIVEKLILTGGFGEGQESSDSDVARAYALTKGIPKRDILIEDKSRFTFENLKESKQIMDSYGLNSALLVSDPFHMKRSMKLAINQNINCKPSPTKTSMYKSMLPKMKSLVYETFYYSLRQLLGEKK